MRKSLTTIGNSLGFVIDKPVLEVLGIGKDTVLDVEARDGALVIRPVGTDDKRSRVRELGRKVMKTHAIAFEKLSK